jgi:hypothetical protein
MSSSSQTPRFLAVIPARAGSKRVPHKNVRAFHGVPLIARTIETVLASDVFQDVIVSTDDAEIGEIARQSGASMPFPRIVARKPLPRAMRCFFMTSYALSIWSNNQYTPMAVLQHFFKTMPSLMTERR